MQELVRIVREEYARRSTEETLLNRAEHLPEEVEEGNVEYKLKLIDPAPGECARVCMCMDTLSDAFACGWQID